VFNIPSHFEQLSNYSTASYINYSSVDIFILKLWTMVYEGKNMSVFCKASDDWQDNYICDIRELEMPHGIYEVFKYCFKDIEIKNLNIFRNLFFGLNGKRIRQGYGNLYNLKLNDKDLDDFDLVLDDIKNYLEFKDKIPVIVANNFKDNTEKYRDYKKISIYKKNS